MSAQGVMFALFLFIQICTSILISHIFNMVYTFYFNSKYKFTKCQKVSCEDTTESIESRMKYLIDYFILEIFAAFCEL